LDQFQQRSLQQPKLTIAEIQATQRPGAELRGRDASASGKHGIRYPSQPTPVPHLLPEFILVAHSRLILEEAL
jgi:hypothetical protein